MSNNRLYKFYWDCGRQGDLEGLFIATSEQVKEAVGRDLNFGSVLGKYSEVYGPLEESEIEEISDNQELIEILEKAIGSKTISGYNPLHYVQILCTCCKNYICESGGWYEHKIINKKYYCATYNETEDKCEEDE
jgi:hypothetical protein